MGIQWDITWYNQYWGGVKMADLSPSNYDIVFRGKWGSAIETIKCLGCSGFSSDNSKPFERRFNWLVVDLPLWKIWVRPLGWWHSHYMEKFKPCSKPPTRFILYYGVTYKRVINWCHCLCIFSLLSFSCHADVSWSEICQASNASKTTTRRGFPGPSPRIWEQNAVSWKALGTDPLGTKITTCEIPIRSENICVAESFFRFVG